VAEAADAQLARIARQLGFEPDELELLGQALTHKSARAAQGRDNERLEFLGDAVLGMVIANALYQRHPEAHEDGLSLMRAALVRKESLAEIARELDLGRAIALGPGELRSGGHNRSSILADAFEAIVGAVYLNAGVARAEALVLRLFDTRLDEVVVSKDAKTRLQEWLQARRAELPRYSVVNVSGADHARHFEVRCELADGSRHGIGRANSRRAAEQAAASELLGELGEVV